MLTAMEVRILNHWTTREDPELHLFSFIKTLYTSNNSNTFVVEYRTILQVRGQKNPKTLVYHEPALEVLFNAVRQKSKMKNINTGKEKDKKINICDDMIIPPEKPERIN